MRSAKVVLFSCPLAVSVPGVSYSYSLALPKAVDTFDTYIDGLTTPGVGLASGEKGRSTRAEELRAGIH